MNHCKVCSVSLSDCSQKRQLGSHTQDSSLCTAQLIRLLCNLGKTEQEAKEYATGYTCKRCFDALQLCTTLKEKLGSVAVRFHAITLTMEGDVKKGSYLLLRIGIQKCVQ